MRRGLFCWVAAVAMWATSATAQDFGLRDRVLADRFLAEAHEIVKQSLTAEQRLFYDIQNSGNGRETIEDTGFGVLREAYRADPEATLELIRRIMEAGESK
ncbi:MAG: hypothetical protein AB3N11_03055 [Arenibacterium sp.]